MNLYDMQQQSQYNPYQWATTFGQGYGASAGHGLGQAAYGQPFGQGNAGGWGPGGGWGSQRQLSQHDVGDVVRQLVPLLPQILAQSQHPQAAFGYGWSQFGQPGQPGQYGRQLTQQDVSEVVRQLLPIMPQILGNLQAQGPLQAAAMYGGYPQNQFGWQGWQNPFANPHQQFGQIGWPQYLSAYGAQTGFGMQRQLTQQDVNEVVRQLTAVVPQVIGNLHGFNQQRIV
jgi:hypothetical protein